MQSKNALIVVLSVLFLGSSIVAVQLYAHSQDLQQENEQLDQENEQLANQTSELSAENQELQAELEGQVPLDELEGIVFIKCSASHPSDQFRVHPGEVYYDSETNQIVNDYTGYERQAEDEVLEQHYYRKHCENNTESNLGDSFGVGGDSNYTETKEYRIEKLQHENEELHKENQKLHSWVEKIGDEYEFDREYQQSDEVQYWGYGDVRVTRGYCVDQEYCRMTITTNDFAEFVHKGEVKDTVTVEFEYGGDYEGYLVVRNWRGSSYPWIFHSQYEDETKYDSNLGINSDFGDAGINFDSREEETILSGANSTNESVVARDGGDDS